MTARTGSIALLAIAALSSPAAASAARNDPAETEARAAFQRAQVEYDLGQFQSALELYSEAYRLKPLPAFLFNLAQCHRQLRQYERATFFYKRYLDLSPTPPSNAAVVEGLLRDVQEKMRLEREEAEGQRELELARLSAANSRPADAPLAKSLQPPLPVSGELRASETAPKSGSVLTKWWLWAGVAAVVAGTAAVAIATAPPSPSLGVIDARQRGN